MLISQELAAEKKTQFRIRISKVVYDEITEYCEHAGIRYKDFFIEHACRYIFTHDADWQVFKASKKNE